MTERTLRTISAGSMMSVMILILLAYFNTGLTDRGAALVGVGVCVLSCMMNVTWQLAGMDEEAPWKWYRWLPHILPSAVASYLVFRILC